MKASSKLFWFCWLFQCTLCILVVVALDLSSQTSRSILIDPKYSINSELYEEYRQQPSTRIHTSGFIRIDTYNLKAYDWVQAQVHPIGSCFRWGGYSAGSAQLQEVMFAGNSMFRKFINYSSENCSGLDTIVSFVNQRLESHVLQEQWSSHFARLDDALAIYPSTEPGLVIRSYFGNNGCTGNVAQYDLLSEKCALFDYPISAIGRFRCNKNDQKVIVSLHDFIDDDLKSYPMCSDDETPRKGDATFHYDLFTDISTQPLSCEEVWDGWVDSVKFQTIQCVL